MQSTGEMETVRHATTQGMAGRAFRYWFPVVVYAGAIFFFSSLSHPEEKLPSFLFTELGDKTLHAVEYGILAALCYRAFRYAAGPAVAPYGVLLAIVGASMYGVTDEAHQAFVPFREASVFDWMADTVGGAIGAVGIDRTTRRNTSR